MEMLELLGESAKRVDAITAILALLAAIFAGYAAWQSYRLAKSIRDELKSDEVLVAGILHNPDLLNLDHRNAVIQTTLFNKAKRKAFVHNVVVKNSKGAVIDVDWADKIDEYGNPQGGSNLIGVVDSAQLCIRESRRKGVPRGDGRSLPLISELAAGAQILHRAGLAGVLCAVTNGLYEWPEELHEGEYF
jgi:hypothetical protein